MKPRRIRFFLKTHLRQTDLSSFRTWNGTVRLCQHFISRRSCTHGTFTVYEISVRQSPRQFGLLVKYLAFVGKRHLPMLRNIRKQAIKVSQEKYGLTAGQLRLFVHYQPSYCEFTVKTPVFVFECVIDHFHVHIVTLELSGQSNANVGLAHLLDDIISLVSTNAGSKNGSIKRPDSSSLSQTTWRMAKLRLLGWVWPIPSGSSMDCTTPSFRDKRRCSIETL